MYFEMKQKWSRKLFFSEEIFSLSMEKFMKIKCVVYPFHYFYTYIKYVNEFEASFDILLDLHLGSRM